MSCMLNVTRFTFESMAGVVRGSHVTTGDRFCGADDNVGGFGNVLVIGRQTKANIFRSVYFLFFLKSPVQSISKCERSRK